MYYLYKKPTWLLLVLPRTIGSVAFQLANFFVNLQKVSGGILAGMVPTVTRTTTPHIKRQPKELL